MNNTKRLRNIKNIDSSKNNKRYLKRSEKAVSEVLGTILTLGITVVLFTSVFAAVTNLPEAKASPHVDFDAEIDVEDELLSITHLGGGTLPAEATSVFIVVDTTSYYYPLDSEEVFIENDEERWRINEKIMIDISEVEITTREIEILIIDQNTRKVLWNSYVTSPAIPRAIVINDLWVNYRRDWEDFANAGEEATLYAEVIPGIDTEIRVLIDLRGLEGYEDNGAWQTSLHNMTHVRGNRYSLELQTSSLQPDGNYRLRVEAHTHAQHLNITREFVENRTRSQNAEWATSRLSLNIGPPRDLRERPDIRIDSDSIRFSPGSPISGDLLTTHAIVKNHGGSSAEVEVEFINRDPTGTNTLFGFITVNVASGGERDISARTEIFSSGEHVIEVNAVNVTSEGGEDLPPESKRYASTTLNVQPTILIVADDHEFGGDSDLMIGALEGADYQFDVHRVTRGDGPPSSVLNRYDITIWLTGRTMGKHTEDPVEEQPTLTSNDRANIQDFLNNGGNLWLIGEGIYEDSSNWGTFLDDNFGINSLDSDSTAPDSDLYGKSILSNTTYILREDVENRGNHIYPGDATCMLEDGMESGNCIAVNFTGVRNGNSFRTAFYSFRFSSMRRGHTSMAANVIQWLGNVTHRESRDVAVTDQDFSTHVPQYKDVVEVTGSVRNNGPIDETVEVRLFINDRIDRTQRISLRLASGEEKDVRFNWTAEPVGIHELKIVVDSYNEIPERNVRNNDITYKDVDVTINVQFSILLVDHDVSASSPVIESLDRLGYEYRLVSKDEELTEDLINRFNAVYWIAGDSEDSIGEEESELLMDYLDNNEGVSLFLQGNTVLTDMTQTGSVDHPLFFQNYLGIGSSIDRTSLPTNLEGVTQDPVSHGMRFEMVEKDLDLDVVQPTHGAEIVLHHQVPLAVRFDGGNFKTLFMGPGLDHVEGPNIEHRSYHDFDCDIDVSSEAANQQLIYTLTKWFGNVDERIELRIADEDITIPENPMLGRSYQIRALIENIGFKESNALIRFKDNDSLIASESIYVPPNGFSDAEVNWRPVFAGHGEHERKIRVLVDPICAVEEIGVNQMGFNNLGVRTTTVYYFYDDMESGSEKWSHETVLANIDGEGPIDYLGEDYEKVYTDIIYNWDYEKSHGIELSDKFSRSDPYSYMFLEPKDLESMGSQDEGLPRNGENYDKWAVTPTFDLSDYSSARLTFNQKYRMVRGMNGAYLQIGYRDENHAGEDGYAWRYLIPSKGSYTGNLNPSDHREDSFGNRIDWAWNGVSGGGSFSWDPVSLELLRYVPEEHRDDVRIRFDYKQYGSGTGFGWFIDDVQVKATRDEGSGLGEEMRDVWQLVTTTDSSGEETTAWWNGVYHNDSPSMKLGIDNSLVTSQIDLTRAKTAHLTAEFKFNINSDSGAPPDGFRVEVSRDNGISWSPINLGARAASGVSGSATTNYWTTSGELNRLLTDISDFTGETILIRFRVITNNAGSYNNYEDESLDFRGIYMNNVTVEGKTVEQ